MKLTTPLLLVPRLRMSGAMPLPPTCLHGVGRENVYYRMSTQSVSVCTIFTPNDVNFTVQR
jgi:hypothetical protein